MVENRRRDGQIDRRAGDREKTGEKQTDRQNTAFVGENNDSDGKILKYTNKTIKTPLYQKEERMYVQLLVSRQSKEVVTEAVTVVAAYPNGDNGDGDAGVAVTAAAVAAALSSASSVSVASSLNPLCKATLERIIFSILTTRGAANLYTLFSINLPLFSIQSRGSLLLWL